GAWAQPPIITFGQQGGMMLPTGEGMGATQLGCEVRSPARAAGCFWISTLLEPWAITPGPAGTQGASVQILVMSPPRAAGILPISTLLAPAGMIGKGSAGCGTGVGVGAAG